MRISDWSSDVCSSDLARAIGQAADEPALFQCGNQPVHAGLALEVERLLHFLERGRNPRFLQLALNEADQFVLLGSKHRRDLLRPSIATAVMQMFTSSVNEIGRAHV